MEAQTSSESLYYIWFVVLIAFLAILFVAKFKFDKTFDKRQERRRMLTYSKIRLSPNEEGQTRALKIKRIRDLR
jgi:beta-lactamase regulating signal transducer with metallopeptidase domain